MSVSLETVKELREKTGAGMMDCKKALQESNGELEAAIDHLRKKGLATAAKKSGRAAAEGTLADATGKDGHTFVLAEVNCETDFVTKTDDFQNYAKTIANLILAEKPANLEKLLELKLSGRTVKDTQVDLIAKIGENIGVRRFVAMSTSGHEKASLYMHPGSRIGVLIKFEDPKGKLTDQLAKEVAMHIAAMSPTYLRREDVSEADIAKEKGIFMEQMANEKKPAEMLEKIVIGKINKHFSELCLEDQIFVKAEDGKTSVKNTLKKVDGDIKIKEFVRLQVGEGIEKKKSDLASEIAAMVK